MIPLIASAALFLGLVVGAWQGYDAGVLNGRRRERIQVIAFLMSRLNDGHVYTPEELAKAIDNGDHMGFDLR